MSWPGWEDFVPPMRPTIPAETGRVIVKTVQPSGRVSRGARMHAVPCFVSLPDLTVFTAEEWKRLGLTGGRRFMSKKEAETFVGLTLRERAGQISQLTCQAPFELHAFGFGGVPLKVGVYRADFCWLEDGKLHVADVKGQARREDLYLWKKRHVLAEHGIAIEEL